jgi:hypothetical protein
MNYSNVGVNQGPITTDDKEIIEPTPVSHLKRISFDVKSGEQDNFNF